MNGRLCGLRWGWLNVELRKRQRCFWAKALRPSLSAHIPRCRTRSTLCRPSLAPPDVNDFNHPAFTGAKTAPPGNAEYEALFDGGCLCPLPLWAGKDAIYFGHDLPYSDAITGTIDCDIVRSGTSTEN